MLTVAKNQTKVILLAFKYNLMREMTNQVTFITNILFMILNNATFIIQWMVLFHLKSNIGGYEINDVLVLWGLAASTYGFSHIFFQKAHEISDLIINGKLDAFLVQPKNVLIGVITSGTNVSAIGDLVYGFIILLIVKCSILNVILFTFFTITGGLIVTAFSIIIGSLSFWIVRGDIISGHLSGIMINVSTYPDGIFKGIVKLILYSLLPVGLTIYMPVKVIIEFNIIQLFIIIAFTIGIVLLAFLVFKKGLKRYSSSNLMSARI